LQDGPQAFSAGELQVVNNWTLSGPWKVTPEYLESLGENSALILRFSAKKAFLVVSSESKKGEVIVDVLNNKKEVIGTKTIAVKGDELYTIFESDIYQNDTTIRIKPSDGLRLHAFTF
jgi:Thioredoxin like C-terminal domain